jgi:hypothetical protein
MQVGMPNQILQKSLFNLLLSAYMRSLLLFSILILFPHLAFAQARDTTTRPEGIVTLEEFYQALSDNSRIIYTKTTSDTLLGPIRGYGASKFYLEDSTYIDRNSVKRITEHWTYANRGATYGAIGGVLIGGIISAVILSRKETNNTEEANSGIDNSNSQGFLGPALLIGGSIMLALPGMIIGAIIGSRFERGYNFPVSSLESER